MSYHYRYFASETVSYEPLPGGKEDMEPIVEKVDIKSIDENENSSDSTGEEDDLEPDDVKQDRDVTAERSG